ncbi:SCO family protein [Flaviaesturariibacter amylovorans]|uniref:Thioredoxin domain-containing protein n=1 Tax=Flaviaesturariibacter amylovorans TaxID=1084520 RepID=A0ABP8HRQ2_9BACT
MSRKRINYIIFFSLLFLGFVGALALFVPDFFKKRIPPVAEVQPFAFTDQDGRTVTQQDIAGKVTAVNFFFTTCRGVCPKMNNNLKPVYEAFKGQKDFLLLSHTSDPEYDSVPVLRRYADSMQVDTRQWRFLTGRKDSLYNAARRSYAIDDPNNNLQSPADEFLHSQFIALVNREGKVMKIYDGLKANEMQELQRDVRKLLEK